MRQSLLQRVAASRERIGSLVSSYAFNRPKDMLREYVQRIDELQRAMALSVSHAAQYRVNAVESLTKRLGALSPAGVLKRGYAIVRKQGVPVTRAVQLAHNDEASIEFQDGTIKTKVQ